MDLEHKFKYEEGVFLGQIKEVPFEELYLKIRKQEGRFYTDEVVKKLPLIDNNHQHYIEWEKRKNTLNRFLDYLKDRNNNKILEIGCGNGWFTHNISSYCKEIIGQDINKTELKQAARLFKTKSTNFICTFDVIDLVKYWQPDLIVFNASLHYFDPKDKIIDQLKNISTKKVEIHVLDTFIYSNKEVAKEAKKRTEEYYERFGVKELSNFYFHYTTSDLEADILRKVPTKWEKILNKKISPFPWLRLK